MTASRSPALENLDAGGLSWAQESVLLTSAPRVLDSQSSSGRGRGDPDEVYHITSHPGPPGPERLREGWRHWVWWAGLLAKDPLLTSLGLWWGRGGGGREETTSGWPPSASCD